MNRGISILELLLTISIIAIVGASTIPVYTNFMVRNYLENKTNETLSSLQIAKTNSISGKEDSIWGVNFSSDITLFKGVNFLTRDTAFDQVYKVPISISISGLSEVTFDRLTGDPSSTGTITLSNNQNETSIITINQFGTIDVN